MARTIPKFSEQCVCKLFESPIGELGIVVSNAGLHAILWETVLEDPVLFGRLSRDKSNSHPVYSKVCTQLEEYFGGQRKKFSIPLIVTGTPFQQSAWKKLQDIPYGQTISYQEQAIRLGGKEKVRAVGRANGMNPIPIIIPCHRVIGKNGSLTGFGGGLDIKAFLLKLESKLTPIRPPSIY